MKPPFGLRAATDADVPAVAGLIAAAFEVYRHILEPPSSSLDKTPAAVHRELETATALVAAKLVAAEAETLVGCVFYAPKEDHVYLSRLAVLPEYQGRGIARALLSAVEDETLDLGAEKIRLQVRLVQKRNRALYGSLGYVFYAYGAHAGYKEPTFVTLEKRLGQNR